MSHQGQTTPFGNLSYEITGHDANGLPIYSANTSLSPTQQDLFNRYQQTQQRAGQQGQDLLTNANFGEIPDISTRAGSIVDTNLQHFVNRWNPIFQQQTSQLDNQLRNQGLTPGTEAYDRAMRSLRLNQNQTIEGYLSSMEPEAYRQSVQSYQLPLTTAASLIQMGQPGSLPQNLIGTPQAQQLAAPNIGQLQQIANQQAQFNYAQQVAQNNAIMQGVSGLGIAALPFIL